MARHRTAAAHAANAPTRPSSRPCEALPTPPTLSAASETSLTRVALYARVSTDKQEREETIASQVRIPAKVATYSSRKLVHGHFA